MPDTFCISAAGVSLAVLHDTGLSPREFALKHIDPIFTGYITDAAVPDYRVRYRRDPGVYAPGDSDADDEVFCGNLYRATERAGGGWRLEFSRFPGGADARSVCSVLDIPPGYDGAELTEYAGCEGPAVTMRYALRVFFEGAALYRGAFVLHGAAVEHRGAGIVFTAPSGTGKTTHTNFWVSELGASVLNGDSPAIRADGGETRICGLPWCGSSRDSVNKSVPLRAVVILRRGEENRIERVTDYSAIYDLLPEIRRMPWVEEQAERAADYLGILIERSAVYRLHCLPEPEAARCALRGLGLW